MAKIKVHEIAKELGKQSKEIISFLQDKGIEAKAAQSSLEEEAAALVRKAFGKREEMKEEAPAVIKEDMAEQKQASVPDDGNKTASVKAAGNKVENRQENKNVRPVQNSGEAPKKKKKIIFVSNPHNSNMPGQRPQNDRRPAQGNRNSNPNSNANTGRQGQGQGQGRPQAETPHKLIRPLTAPSVPESMQVDFKENARKMMGDKLL